MQTKWWHGKVAYQIYPKSFKDTNGDGFGDLPGIIEKIPYLHDLGIDLLWISPIYKSPFADQGYDIADYQDIDPIFGSLEDFKKLKAEADKYGIGIIMAQEREISRLRKENERLAANQHEQVGLSVVPRRRWLMVI